MEVPNEIHKPRPKEFIRKADCQNSLKGVISGILILITSVASLSLFFGLNHHQNHKYHVSSISSWALFSIVID